MEKNWFENFSFSTGLKAKGPAHRSDRGDTISYLLEGAGWDRDVQGYEQPWNSRFPGLPIVADGREITGKTRKGRGTTVFDLFRKANTYKGKNLRGDSIVVERFDFLSVKTDCIEPGGSLPSRIEVSTGNQATIDGIVAGALSGASIPTLIFAGTDDGSGGFNREGKVLAVDVGRFIRDHGVAGIDEGPYTRGKAPPVYMKWSSRRACGGKGNGAAKLRRMEGQEYPYVDTQGRKWTDAGTVHYPELVVSLGRLVTDEDWTDVTTDDLSAYVDGLPWNLWSSDEMVG